MRTLLLLSVLSVLTLTACDDTVSPPDLSPDLSSPADMGPSCSMSPMTNDEIINACTNAESYDKTPFFPSLAPNGELPALP